MSLTGNFIEDDANMEEINTGSSMSRTRARHIIKVCETMTHANYVYDTGDYEEAKKVLRDD